MADDSLDPQDQASNERLARRLAAIRESINRDLKAAESTEQKSSRRERQADRRVAREESLERGRRIESRGRGTSEGVAREEQATAAARKEQARFGELDLTNQKGRLSAAQKIRQAEIEIGNARAKAALAASRERISRFGTAGAVARPGEFLGHNIAAPGRRGTISAEEIAARREVPAYRPPAATGPALGPGNAAGREQYRAASAQAAAATEREARSLNALHQVQTQVARSSLQAAGGQQAFSAGLNEAGVAAGLAGNRLRKNGALTTEFIEAARRGEVDIRELGYQVTATIGKFAGWTAAATAVFGAAAAISQLGRGAIDSLDGVNNLRRILTDGFSTDEAQKGLRDLSKEFNLPIGQVADATYQMSKIFGQSGGLTASLTGAKAALFAVKVGELDAATATRYLTGIVQGFGLSADELTPVMDAVNQATNKFGGNVGSLVSGVAGAAGSFRSARGEFRDLIALIETGQKVTGRSGTEIGTALRRTSEIIQRPERRTTILDLLGVDPQKDSITEVLDAAAKQLKTASPELRSQILRAITTPQLASSTILPLLQHSDLTKRIRNEIRAGGPAEGSSARELKQALKSPREEIAKFGNELQRLGSVLATTGALDPFVVLLKGLNLGLDTATRLLGIFDAFPAPLRSAAVFAAEIAAAVALARRFDVGRYIPGKPDVLRRNPEVLARKQVITGLRDTQSAVADERRGAAGRVVRTRLNLDYLKSSGATQEQINAAEREYNESLQRRRALTAQENIISKEIEATQSGLNRAHYSPGTLSRTDVAHEPIGGGGPSAGRGGVPVTTRGGPSYTGSGRSVVSAISNTEKYIDEERRYQARLLQYGRSAEGVGYALDRGRGALSSVRGSLTGVRGKLGGAINRVRGFGGEIGGLDAALIGLFAAYEVYNHVADRIEQTNKAIERLDTAAARIADPDKINKLAGKELNRAPSLTEKAENAAAGGINFLRGRSNLVHEAVGPVDSPYQRQQAAAERASREADAIANANRKGVGLTGNQINERLRKRLGEAKTQAQREKAYAQAERELSVSRSQIYGNASNEARTTAYNKSTADIEALKTRLITDVKGLNYELDLLASAKEITAFGLKRTNKTQLGYKNTPKSQAAVGGAIARARELAAEATDPKKQAELIQSAEQLEQAVTEEAQKNLERGLAYARTPQEAGRARGSFLKTQQKIYVDNYKKRLQATRSHLNERQKQLDEINKRVDSEKDAGGALSEHAAEASGRSTDPKDLKQLTAQQKAAKGKIAQLHRSLKRQSKEFRAIAREQAAAQLELELTFFDARTERLQSETADPVAQANILVTRMKARTAKVVEGFRKHIQSQADVDKAVAQQNEALQQAAQAQLARFKLTQDVSTARFSIHATDDQVLHRQLADAQAYLGRVQATPGINPDEILQAQQQVYEIQRQVAEKVKQDAAALLEALKALALAKAGDDPIKQAQINLRYAKLKLAQDIKNGATKPEKIQDRAEIINSRRGLQDARLQERLDEKEFQFNMGKLTREQYISFLATFIRNHAYLRKTNAEWYRRLKLQLKQLKDDTNSDRDTFELNVGDIRLPTVYEVRRALGGRAGARAAAKGNNINTNNNNTINLYVAKGADLGEVGRVLERYTGAHVRAQARAAGAI